MEIDTCSLVSNVHTSRRKGGRGTREILKVEKLDVTDEEEEKNEVRERCQSLCVNPHVCSVYLFIFIYTPLSRLWSDVCLPEI